jgi:hypothetical protein
MIDMQSHGKTSIGNIGLFSNIPHDFNDPRLHRFVPYLDLKLLWKFRQDSEIGQGFRGCGAWCRGGYVEGKSDTLEIPVSVFSLVKC